MTTKNLTFFSLKKNRNNFQKLYKLHGTESTPFLRYFSSDCSHTKKKKGIMAFLSVLRITLNTNTHTLTHTKKYGILRKTNNINNQKSTALDCVRHKMLPYHSLCGGKSYYLALIQTLTDFKDNIPKEFFPAIYYTTRDISKLVSY